MSAYKMCLFLLKPFVEAGGYQHTGDTIVERERNLATWVIAQTEAPVELPYPLERYKAWAQDVLDATEGE